jgi:hypothetical protein
VKPLGLLLSVALVACGGSKASAPPPATPEPAAGAPSPSPVAAAPAPASGDAKVLASKPIIEVICTPEDPPKGCDALKLMASLAGVIDANQGDCKRLAAAINAWWVANKDAAQAAKLSGGGITEDERAALQQRHDADLKAIFGAIMGGTGACQEDPDFTTALKSIDM